ncbi:hypothetical protein FRC04_004493 [Tulasnella sp. 424]|nr:hypothetical protein FRC04_004493 [Tulasnella sp. 424]
MSPQQIDVPHFTLNTGAKLPAVGLGCWMGYPGGGEDCENMAKTAIKLGYRHIDTAAGYGNEEHVGKAIRESGVPRSEIFLVTKLNNKDHGRVAEAFQESLDRLGCEYIDLYLMHWPQAQNPDATDPRHDGSCEGKILTPDQSPTYVETWQAMEKLLDTGKVKAIGVSNFSIKTLEVLLPQAKVVPAANQVQLHPCLPSFDLLAYCAEKGIHVTAYTPLGRKDSPFFSDDTIKSISEKHEITVAQVLLSWGVQRGTSVIPKSVQEERLKSNFTLVKLDDEDMQAIDNVHKKPGLHRQLLVSPIIDTVNGTVWGWTHEQLGWNLDNAGYWKS